MRETDDIYHALTGLKHFEDIRDDDFRLRPDKAYYLGDGVWVCPDGTMEDDGEEDAQEGVCFDLYGVRV